jgi:uncharacterized protein (TIGR02001 family)
LIDGHSRSFRSLTIALAALGALLVDENCALGQTATSNYGGAISLGGHGWSSFEGAPTASGHDASQLEFSFRGGVATDYMYRGTTLSDHKPAIGGAVEATFGPFYAAAAVASVKLPTQPTAEITMSAGSRATIGGIDFDLGVSYFLYPGEISAGPDTDYWQAAIRADKRLNEWFRVAGGFAYSPNVSNTGAWSWYAAGGAGIDVPGRFLPADIGVSFTAGAGYSWFGNQSPELGGFPLPAYLNWQAGVTFTYKVFNLDLRYYDTNLSKENCFVLTGDPNARPGGAIDLLTNPEGLTSRWCSATFVAKASVALGN